jgi:hypothetical protein
MPVFRLVSASDFQAFMDIRPTTRTGTAAIHMVTIRRIIGQLSIIALRSGLITGGTDNAYFFGITISGIKRMVTVANTVQSHVAVE